MGRKIVPVTLERSCLAFVGSGLTLQNDIGNPKGRTGRGTLFLLKRESRGHGHRIQQEKVQSAKVHDMKKPPLERGGKQAKESRIGGPAADGPGLRPTDPIPS